MASGCHGASAENPLEQGEQCMEDAFMNIARPVLIILASIAVLLLVRIILFRILRGWAVRTKTRFDNIIITSFRKASVVLVIAIAIHIGLAFSGIPEKHLDYFRTLLDVVIIFILTLIIADIAVKMLKQYIHQARIPIPATGLAYAVLRGIILIIGLLIILGMLGISIAPLITALGVGGLAAALALQDTLANLFAGIHILMEQSIRVGDFVRLESGQEGYVVDITWRTTQIRMLANNMVVIPNSKLSQSVVTNYYLPEKTMSFLLPISVSYASDPHHVERILLEEARKGAQHIPGLLAEPEPFVRFIPGFGNNSLDFTVICQVREFTDQFLAQHELRKEIFKRFQEENIEIPLPQQTVYLRKDRDPWTPPPLSSNSA